MTVPTKEELEQQICKAFFKVKSTQELNLNQVEKFCDLRDAVMPLLRSYGDSRELEGRIDELSQLLYDPTRSRTYATLERPGVAGTVDQRLQELRDTVVPNVSRRVSPVIQDSTDVPEKVVDDTPVTSQQLEEKIELIIEPLHEHGMRCYCMEQEKGITKSQAKQFLLALVAEERLEASQPYIELLKIIADTMEEERMMTRTAGNIRKAIKALVSTKEKE